mgnify:CR=1 FL=1
MNILELYVDLIWLLNLLFDWLVLLTVAWVMRKPFQHLKIFIASVYASLIIPITLVFDMDLLNHPLIKFIYSFGIIWIAFNFKNIKQYLLYFLTFYFINFAIGGGLFALHYFLKANQISLPWLSHVGYGDRVSWIFVIVAFPIILMFTKGRLQNIAVIKMHHDNLYQIKLIFKGKELTLKGFVDTGNQLNHPFLEKPIMLIDQNVAEHWFSPSLIDKMKHQSIDDVDRINEDVNFHYIPYIMAGGQQGILPVFLIDEVKIYANDNVYSTKNVYVGVHFGKFSENLFYQCLLHPELFQTKNTKVQHVKGVS